MPDLLTGFALISVVLIVAALAAGVVERAPVSFPIIFLAIGVLLGERGLGLLVIDVHDATLEVVAVLSLALVLFLDAVKLRFDDGARGWIVPALVLGLGTLLTIALIAGAALAVLGLSPIAALMVGAILASTDPVVLRDVLRDGRIPRPVRRALSIEAGTNDVVVLPIVLVLIAVADRGASAPAGDAWMWPRFLAGLLVVGPLAGFAIGGAGSWAMAWVDRRTSVRREYQALYGVGLVLAAYAAGQAVGGDGFLAAFAAGLAVAVLNAELCDCFLEYGEITAEMAMLLAFILFGVVLSTLIPTVAIVPALLFAALTLLVARPLAVILVLRRASLSRAARGFLAWFGPRGLSALLLALLVVIHDVPDAERLLAIVGVVVVASVIAHGVSAAPLAALYARLAARETLPEERESSVAGLFDDDAGAAPRSTPDELAVALDGPAPPIVLDVRSRSQYDEADGQIPGSVRVLPDAVAEWAAAQSERRPVVAYCT